MAQRPVGRHGHARRRGVEHHVHALRGGIGPVGGFFNQRVHVAIRNVVTAIDHARGGGVGAGTGRQVQLQALALQVAPGLGQPQPGLRAGDAGVEQHAQLDPPGLGPHQGRCQHGGATSGSQPSAAW
jgi:hypothetical protein